MVEDASGLSKKKKKKKKKVKKADDLDPEAGEYADHPLVGYDEQQRRLN